MTFALNVYFLLFLAGYFLTYPLRVLMQNNELSVLPLTVAPGAALVALSLLVNFPRARLRVRGLVLWGLLATLSALYAINASIVPEFTMLGELSRKHAVFLLAVAPVLLLHSHLDFRRIVRPLALLLVVLAVVQLLGVMANSFLYRMPVNPEALNDKYFVGFLLRAGAGYMDPNFLAINFLLLLFAVRGFVAAGAMRIVAQVCLVAAIGLTFSRSAWVLLVLASLYLAATERGIAAATKLLGVFAAALAAMLTTEYSVLLRRFTDAEGVGSAQDRLEQYDLALGAFDRHSGLLSMVQGLGGPDWFYATTGRHLHSFYMGLVLDAGWLATVLVGLTLYYAFRKMRGQWRVMLVLWAAAVASLPTVPDTFYMAVALGIAGTWWLETQQAAFVRTVRASTGAAA